LRKHAPGAALPGLGDRIRWMRKFTVGICHRRRLATTWEGSSNQARHPYEFAREPSEGLVAWGL
jgi:hypothetical protein